MQIRQTCSESSSDFLSVCFGALVLLLLLFMLFPEVVHLDRCFSGGDEEAAQEG